MATKKDVSEKPKRQILNSMRYKSFTWEYNPATCTYSCQRSYVAHKYPELAGVELEDMDTNEVVITGDGEFFGPNAYSNWLKLNAEFKTFGPGQFYHPVFTDVTHALMTRLQAKMEPRENYVAYSFEIVGSIATYDINTPSVIASTNPDTGSNTTGSIKVGDIVYLNGHAYYTSYGDLPRSSYVNNSKYVVTQVKYDGTHPIHCGTLGWCSLDDVKLVGSENTSAVTRPSDEIYVVVAGDTLSGISTQYGANWKNVAEYNGIKNPNLITVGQKIRIPRSMITKPTKLKSGGTGIKNTTQSSSSKGLGGNANIIHVIN